MKEWIQHVEEIDEGNMSSQSIEAEGRAYLERVELCPYLEDALKRGGRSVQGLRTYFQSVLEMRHIKGREFEYVKATKWNRRSFVSVLSAAAEPLREDKITVADLHQLVCLICADFPRGLVDDFAALIFKDGLVLLPCGALMSAFAVYFYYESTFQELKSEESFVSTNIFAANAKTQDPLPLSLLGHADQATSYEEFCYAVLTASESHDLILQVPSPTSDEADEEDDDASSQQSLTQRPRTASSAAASTAKRPISSFRPGLPPPSNFNNPRSATSRRRSTHSSPAAEDSMNTATLLSSRPLTSSAAASSSSSSLASLRF